jgi:hypothetical protein
MQLRHSERVIGNRHQASPKTECTMWPWWPVVVLACIARAVLACDPSVPPDLAAFCTAQKFEKDVGYPKAGSAGSYNLVEQLLHSFH